MPIGCGMEGYMELNPALRLSLGPAGAGGLPVGPPPETVPPELAPLPVPVPPVLP